MLTFVLEQSTTQGSAAILRHATCVAESAWQSAGQLGSRIYGAVSGLLAEARLQPGDIDQYIVGLGPGSYTGLRIALGFINGLAAPAGRPVFGIPSAVAVAANVVARNADATTVQVVGDARRERLWVGTFRVANGGGMRQQGAFSLVDIRAAAASLLPEAMLATAEWPRLSSILPDCVPTPERLIREATPPTAAVLGLVGLEWVTAGLASPGLEPIYLHPAVFTAAKA